MLIIHPKFGKRILVSATVMDDDEELEKAMLGISPSKLQVQSCKYSDITLTKCQNL